MSRTPFPFEEDPRDPRHVLHSGETTRIDEEGKLVVVGKGYPSVGFATGIEEDDLGNGLSTEAKLSIASEAVR